MKNKMDLYCATFVSGGQQIIERQLKKKPANRFKIVEVPIIFTDRTLGESKMSKGIFREAVVGVIALRFKSLFKKYRRKNA